MEYHPAMSHLVNTVKPNTNPVQTTGRDYRLNRLNAAQQQAADNYRKR